MRTTVFAALVAVLPAFATASLDIDPKPRPLTAVERTTLLADLEGSRDRFLRSVEDLSEAQWRFKSAPERWSIAEVAEHITLADKNIGQIVRVQLLTTPEIAPESNDSTERRIRAMLADRSWKAQAPEGFIPSGTWATQQALVAAFKEVRGSLIDYVRTTEDPIRWHRQAHPFGSLDGYQWVILLAAHADRHVVQIEEVKKAAGYTVAQ